MSFGVNIFDKINAKKSHQIIIDGRDLIITFDKQYLF